VFNVVFMTGMMFGLLEFGLLHHFDISYLHPIGIVEAGPGVAALFFLIYPLGGAAFAQFTAPMRYYDMFLRETARTIRVDILRVEDYAAIMHPAVIVFVTSCIIIGALLVVPVLLDVPEIEQIVDLTIAIFAPIAILGTANLCVPALILRTRFVSAISQERNFVLRGLQGDTEALAASRSAADYNRVELLAYLNVLNNLSEWPVGPHLQKIILFGLLPPVAWVLAAAVENALY
jgi:hypothetical protein